MDFELVLRVPLNLNTNQDNASQLFTAIFNHEELYQSFGLDLDTMVADRTPQNSFQRDILPARLDPFQTILNVQWGNAIQVPDGVWWRMPTIPDLTAFSFVCAVYVSSKDVDNSETEGTGLEFLQWGQSASQAGNTDGITESNGASSVYSRLEFTGSDGAGLNAWSTLHSGTAYSCGFFIKCQTHDQTVEFGPEWPEAPGGPGQECIYAVEGTRSEEIDNGFGEIITVAVPTLIFPDPFPGCAGKGRV